jgi:hypothetical protein
MTTAADILAQAENVDHRRTATVRMLLRQDLARQHADLEAELLDARNGDDMENRTPQAPVIAQRIVDLEAEIEAAKVSFTFRAVGRRAWVDLLAAHPPTKAQIKALADVTPDVLRRPTLEFNPEKFPVAAIAATLVEPEMTEDDVRRLEAALSDAQWSQLWGKAIEVNVGASDPKASRVAGLILRLSEQSETTAAPEESADQTS